MPYKEKPLVKVNWSIGEVAERLSVASSKIRFYTDDYFKDWFNLERDKKGNRRFKYRDVKVLEAIRYLITQRGKTLEGVKDSLRPRMYLFDKYL